MVEKLFWNPCMENGKAELIPKPAMTGEGILSGISNFIKGDAETYRPGFKANTTLF
jgi:hypothetical protein